MDWATVLTTAAFYTVYPVTITANVLLAVLQALAIPWPLYIFLSVAGALGVSAGIFLHFLSGYMHQLLNISHGSQDNEFPNSKNKRVGDGSSNTSYLHSPSQKIRHGNGNGNEERTGIRGLWPLPGFKTQRVAKRLAKWRNEDEDENEFENRSGSEWIYKGERDKENLLVTMILEEDEEDDDDGEGNMDDDDDDDDDERI